MNIDESCLNIVNQLDVIPIILFTKHQDDPYGEESKLLESVTLQPEPMEM